eukprot:XP_027299198.1 voltage-gated potassium channel subunit beta-2 isoform X3 [Anas platyrhynchos]
MYPESTTDSPARLSLRQTGSPGMIYRNLGKSGLRVSCLGLGTWVTFGGQITDEMAEQLMTLAYDNGINLFDTAEVYAAGKAEVVLGNIIKKKGWRRSSLVITTKIFWGGKAETERGLSRKHIIEGLKASLERLQLDYVDVVFANRPDPNTPMEGDPFSSSKSRTFIIEGTSYPQSEPQRHFMGQNPLLSLILIPSPPPPETILSIKCAKENSSNSQTKIHPLPPEHLASKGTKQTAGGSPPRRLISPLLLSPCMAAVGPCCRWTRCFSPVHGAQSAREQGECAGGGTRHGPCCRGFQVSCLDAGGANPLQGAAVRTEQLPGAVGPALSPPTQHPASCTQPPPAPGCPCLPPPCTCRTRLSPFSLVSRPMQSCWSRLTKPLVPTSPVPGRAASPLVHALVVLNQTLSAFSFLLPPFGVAAPPALQPSLHGSQLPGASS